MFKNKVMSVFVAGGLAAALPFADAAMAQEGEWPTEDTRIRLVVPFNPGGSADRLARGLASFLPEHLNDAVVTVVNKPGGSGALGATWFSRQPADGSYFLVMQAVPYLANNILIQEAPIAWEDFDFLNAQWSDYMILAVSPESEYQSLEELIAAMRNEPGAVSASIIHGSGAHLQALIMMDVLGIPRDNVRWVTFDGGSPQRMAVVGNQVDFTVVAAEGSLGIKDQINTLAVLRRDGATEDYDAPPLNEALAELGEPEVPLLAGNTIAVIAHDTFDEDYPERYRAFVDGYRAALESEGMKRWLSRSNIGGDWMGPEESETFLTENFEALRTYKDLIN